MRLNVSCTLLVSEQCGGGLGRGAKASRLFSLVLLGMTPVKLHYGIAIAWRPRPYLPRSAGQYCGNSKRKAALWYGSCLAAAAVPAALGSLA
jgi:hypothetical protein